MSTILATDQPPQDVRFPRGWIPIGYTVPWMTPPPAPQNLQEVNYA